MFNGYVAVIQFEFNPFRFIDVFVKILNLRSTYHKDYLAVREY